MALPYTSPGPSNPGTPTSLSRPGTPSKMSRGINSFLSNLSDNGYTSAEREKLHLTTSTTTTRKRKGTATGTGGVVMPRFLQPFLRIIPVSVPASRLVIYFPVLVLVRRKSDRHDRPGSPLSTPLSPSHGSSRSRPRRARGISSTPLRAISDYRLTPLGFLVAALLLFFTLGKLKRHSHRVKIPFVPSSTNVLSASQIAAVWRWEIQRGHYPSSRRTPTSVDLAGVGNPAVDASTWVFHPRENDPKTAHLPKGPSRFPAGFTALEALQPIGPARHYLNITNPQVDPTVRRATPYPPRPVSHSTLDLDVVMDHCDFTTNRYVRDCLEVLRTGAGLEGDRRVRRGAMPDWRQTYLEDFHAKNDKVSERETSERPESQRQPQMQPILAPDIMQSLGYIQLDPGTLTPSQARNYQNSYAQEPLSLESSLRNPPNLTTRQRTVGSGQDSKHHPSHPSADPECDPDYPKIFHIFWAGPFTDKPYLALTSYLFTQNLALHLQPGSAELRDFLEHRCRPQLWIWINPGPAASLPNPRARQQMFQELRDNPWSAPFLHERFDEVIKFKLWNTTEQLDHIPEMRPHWRNLPLFNSGGVRYGAAPIVADEVLQDEAPEDRAGAKRANLRDKPGEKQPGQADDALPLKHPKEEQLEEEMGRFGGQEDVQDIDEALAVKGAALNATAAPKQPPSAKGGAGLPTGAKQRKAGGKKDEMLQRIGSTSSKDYDRLTVVLSDMARFVLTHRYGGIYLDADTIFLRDWEELWGWKGAFAYRWSRLEKYNTAVLKMNRNSAIGSFLFKSALANGLDFHPMTISKYTKDANLEGLLLRLPDALFDSAWLNTEYYQRDRPAYPYFKRFEDFFDPPKDDSAAPLSLGFEGFFRGAFSYHFHNFWWIPFDAARNWPDLGPRFIEGERKARYAALQAKAPSPASSASVAASLANRKQAGPTPTASPDDRASHNTGRYTATSPDSIRIDQDDVSQDVRDLSWATVLKRTFEAYLRGERPSMYGEWIEYGRQEGVGTA